MPPRKANRPAQEVLDEFDDLLDIACDDGNWNYDPYLHGMANGMILMRSVVSGEEPEYLEAPEEWLADHPRSKPALEYQAGFRKARELLAGTVHQAIAPRKQDLQKTYYHGTSSEASVKRIIQEGIKPRDLRFSRERGRMAPVAGRVYITPDLCVALEYALKSNESDEDSEYTYVFVIDGLNLRSDIQPDEDMVSDILAQDHVPDWLLSMAEKYLSKRELTNARVYGLEYAATVGKKLLMHMTDEQKAALLDLQDPVPEWTGVSVAGIVMPNECWRLPADRTKLRKAWRSDGCLGLFTIAEKIWTYERDHWR